MQLNTDNLQTHFEDTGELRGDRLMGLRESGQFQDSYREFTELLDSMRRHNKRISDCLGRARKRFMDDDGVFELEMNQVKEEWEADSNAPGFF